MNAAAVFLVLLALSSAWASSPQDDARRQPSAPRVHPAKEWRLERLPIRIGFVTRARTLGSAAGDVFVVDPSAHSIRRISLDGREEFEWPLTVALEAPLEGSPNPCVIQLTEGRFAVVASLVKPFRDDVLLLDDRSEMIEFVPKPTWPGEVNHYGRWVARARAFGDDLYWFSGGSLLAGTRALPWGVLRVVRTDSSGVILDLDGDDAGPIAQLEQQDTGPRLERQYVLTAFREGDSPPWLGVIPVTPGDVPIGFFALGSTAVVYDSRTVRMWDAKIPAWTELEGITGEIQRGWRVSAESIVFAARADDGESVWLLRND